MKRHELLIRLISILAAALAAMLLYALVAKAIYGAGDVLAPTSRVSGAALEDTPYSDEAAAQVVPAQTLAALRPAAEETSEDATTGASVPLPATEPPVESLPLEPVSPPPPVSAEALPEAQGSGSLSAADFRTLGVLAYNGWRVTWYNPLVLGTTHAALGLYTVGVPITDRGDGIGVVDGLVAVSLPAHYPYGTLIDTPFGAGICVDHSEGAMDVVVWW